MILDVVYAEDRENTIERKCSKIPASSKLCGCMVWTANYLFYLRAKPDFGY